MKKITSYREYRDLDPSWHEELDWLYAIVKKTKLEETIKWGIPVFCLNNKNVIGLIRLKGGVGIWFYKGSFLKDEQQLLVNAQEGKTKGMRSIKVYNTKDISETTIEQYILEAIEVERKGLKIEITKKKTANLPSYFEKFLAENKAIELFNTMSTSCKREYIEYVDSAKKEETKLRRMLKSLELIKENKGLHDKYKK